MSDTFKLIVNDDFEFQLTKEDVNTLDSIPLSKNTQHIITNKQSTAVTIEDANARARQYTVMVNGNAYKVNIKNALDALIEDMGLGLGLDTVENDIFAPMPGVILDVMVNVGDTVKEGDVLCILEAMKMENALVAPRDGVIKSVEVGKADTVEKNVLLLTLEPLQ